LDEEIEGFNSIASLHTDDILTTLTALNHSKIEPVLIPTKYEIPLREKNKESDHTWLNAFANLMSNMLLHNFFIDEVAGGMFNQIDNHESHWVYAYSQN